jgi:hypothetical protein
MLWVYFGRPSCGEIGEVRDTSSIHSSFIASVTTIREILERMIVYERISSDFSKYEATCLFYQVGAEHAALEKRLGRYPLLRYKSPA